jgi:hypothetical protein
MSDNKNDKNVGFYGKIAKFPKNTKAKSAYSFLENIRIPKNKLWYFIIEKEIVVKDNIFEELQIIKYNNKEGVDCAKFIRTLKSYYSDNETITEHIKNLVIDGSESFSIIRNIPNVDIDGKKLITILTEDLIKLLYK